MDRTVHVICNILMVNGWLHFDALVIAVKNFGCHDAHETIEDLIERGCLFMDEDQYLTLG